MFAIYKYLLINMALNGQSRIWISAVCSHQLLCSFICVLLLPKILRTSFLFCNILLAFCAVNCSLSCFFFISGIASWLKIYISASRTSAVKVNHWEHLPRLRVYMSSFALPPVILRCSIWLRFFSDNIFAELKNYVKTARTSYTHRWNVVTGWRQFKTIRKTDHEWSYMTM